MAANRLALVINALDMFCNLTVSTRLSDELLAIGSRPEIVKFFRPLTWVIHQDSTLLSVRDQLNCGLQYGALHYLVKGFTKIIAHWMIDENSPRRLNLRNQVPACCDAHGGNTSGFYHSAYQTHGLMIERSGRAGDQNINFILPQLLNKGRR